MATTTQSQVKTLKLCIYLDGTWNTPENRTNVYSLYEQTKGTNGKNLHRNHDFVKNETQIKYYDKGVGTRLTNVMQGGIFGRGLDLKIKQAYRFICEHYIKDHTELYIFGFSRGAYTARSLVGMLNRIGIIDAKAVTEMQKPKYVNDVMNLYRKWPRKPKTFYTDEKSDKEFHKNLDQCEKRKDQIRRDTDLIEQPCIKFLGVWDTVGSLGIPAVWWLTPLKRFRKKYTFHDTGLAPIVITARHALAVDEHRPDFKATMWTDCDQTFTDLKQMWFVGAHADIGGGVQDNHLHHLPRYWMQQEAIKSGLRFRRELIPVTNTISEPVTDSYGNFLSGAYAFVKGHKGRYYRKIKGGGLNEELHPSVLDYVKSHQNYLPPNLP